MDILIKKKFKALKLLFKKHVDLNVISIYHHKKLSKSKMHQFTLSIAEEIFLFLPHTPIQIYVFIDKLWQKVPLHFDIKASAAREKSHFIVSTFTPSLFSLLPSLFANE